MKNRRSVLSQLWQKCFPGSTKENALHTEPTRLPRVDDATAQGYKRPGRVNRSGIEMLEGRIAPASLINPSTVVFTDLDGDKVTVQFSKPLFIQSGTELTETLNSVFKFSDGGSVYTNASQDPGTPQQLQLIDLTKIKLVGTAENSKNLAAGVSITVTSEKAGAMTGDGFTNVGAIVATHPTNSLFSVSLGKVTIDGDLAQIDAGNSANPVGIQSLTVKSLGAVSGTQQTPPTGTSLDIESKIIGALGSLTVLDDVKTAYVNVVNGGAGGKAVGTIGKITIGGSLIGTAEVATTSNNTGLIQAASNIGSIKIGSGFVSNGTDNLLSDGIIGGGGKNSGAIIAGGKIGNITINGDLAGGGGETSGSIIAAGAVGKTTIGVGTAGHGILGGAGKNSGTIQGSNSISNITLNGDLLGGTGEGSGAITATGDLNSVKIFGKIDVLTETTTVLAGINSGRIYTKSDLGSVTVTGNLEGGAREGTGTIVSDGKVGLISIGGSIIGGNNQGGGIVAGGKLTKIEVAGDLQGGTGFFAGFIEGRSDIGLIKIGGDLKGNLESLGERSGIITSAGSITEIVIGGSVIGGKGEGTGSIQAALSGTGTLSKVTIGKQLLGGEGNRSGLINSEGKIGTVIINATGTGVALQGAKGIYSGSIQSAGAIQQVKISGDVLGGEGHDSGSVQSHGLLANLSISGKLSGGIGDRSGSILSHDDLLHEVAGDLGKLVVGGAVTAGQGDRSGAIYADGNLVSVTLGNLDVGTFQSGTAGDGSAVIGTGLGMIHSGDAGKIVVNGSMNGRGSNHSLLEIRGSLDSLSVRDGVSNGDLHIAGNLNKLSVGTTGRNGVEAGLDQVVLTVGGIAPTNAKLATAIAKITITGDVTDSQILAGYDLSGQGTNADAQIGSVKVSGNWAASDLVAGIKAANGEFGDENDAVIDGGNATITSRIANVIIGGTVSGTNGPTDPTNDHFGFVAQEIGKFKVGGANVSIGDLASDVTIREIA